MTLRITYKGMAWNEDCNMLCPRPVKGDIVTFPANPKNNRPALHSEQVRAVAFWYDIFEGTTVVDIMRIDLEDFPVFKEQS